MSAHNFCRHTLLEVALLKNTVPGTRQRVALPQLRAYGSAGQWCEIEEVSVESEMTEG